MSSPATTMTSGQARAERKSGSRWIIYLLLIIFAVFFLMPVYVALMTALKDQGQVTQSAIWAPPTAPTLQNFATAFNKLSTGFTNSIMLVIPAVIISAFLGSMNGYVLSKWKFRNSDLIFTLILFGMFIPYQSVLIPLVVTLQTIQRYEPVQLYGTIAGLILVHVIY